MSKIALEGNASGTGTFTIASPNSNSNYTLTLPTSTGTVVVTGGAQTIEFAAGSAAAPSITFTGDTNTGIFSPGADTIAFAEGGAESMRIDSSGNVGIGTNSPTQRLDVVAANSQIHFGAATTGGGYLMSTANGQFRISGGAVYDGSNWIAKSTTASIIGDDATGDIKFLSNTSLTAGNSFTPTERMRIDSSGNVVIGHTTASYRFQVRAAKNTTGIFLQQANVDNANDYSEIGFGSAGGGSTVYSAIRSLVTNPLSDSSTALTFSTTNGFTFAERARITSGGQFLLGKTADNVATAGVRLDPLGSSFTVLAEACAYFNRQNDDGVLVYFRQANTDEGNISVSGNTVSYNGFSGGHWTQLQQGRGYNPEILRGTVMSSIGDMCEWKSVVWDEVIEHPAVPAVEAKEAVLDEEGNVVEPAVEAVEGKDAWTETFNKREAYLGQLPVGATFEEDGVTKTVVDDGNERLPKVKISDVVGDKAVYGVFQTWDEVQDMLVTSLGAFVVRIAAGVTVQIGDLLESNGDGCAKVQDDDVIRNKTIGKVTSITPSATYADGSYTVPAVLYCG